MDKWYYSILIKSANHLLDSQSAAQKNKLYERKNNNKVPRFKKRKKETTPSFTIQNTWKTTTTPSNKTKELNKKWKLNYTIRIKDHQ